MRRLILVVTAFLFVSTAGFVLFSDALGQGEASLIQRRYRDAIGHLERALTEAAPGTKDRVLLLLARAQVLAGEPAAGVATYQRLLDEMPQSPFARKAHFQRAEALAAGKQYREAAELYRTRIEELTGIGRKEEIAATYLALADKALALEKPDHGRAVTFFDLAVELGLGDTKARATRLQAAAAVLASGNFAGAIQRLQPLVDELDAANGKPRAMLLLGRAYRGLGQQAQARTVLRDLAAAFATAPEAADAAHEIALTYGVPSPAPNELDRAVAALRALAQAHPTHPEAKRALFLEAVCYAHVGRHEDALRALRAFLAQDGVGLLAEAATAQARTGDMLAAQGKLEDAITAWRQFLKSHPSHGDWQRVQQAIVDAEYELGRRAFARGIEGHEEARRRFEAFAAAYPLDPRNPEIAAALGDMLAAEKKFDAAREAYARCVSKYPGTEAASRAQFRIGTIFENDTFDWFAALKAYRLVTFGSYARHAQARIARLERKHLALHTTRSFRTDEPARFTLTSRNIEKVRVRVYRLDLATYFRSTHTAGDIDRLAVEVIEPDRTFDDAVADYKAYRETTREVLVAEAGTGPGAYIVKVDDRELEATTMVLVTDVALIAKTSRHECFVFTQNLKENRVEVGIQVALSDGTKILAEGTTDATGVWRWRGKELKDLTSLRVFAVNAAGSGASTLDLSGLGYRQGLTPKGYLFTDRAAYQPGQVVHVKGILRDVKDGLYALPEAGHRLQILTSSGRLIVQRPITCTDFGTFTADLLLPADAEIGEWQVRVDHATRKEAFTAGFEVARYERPRLSVTATSARNVVFRGEAITGNVRVAHFHGEPAVGKTVQIDFVAPDGTLVRRSGVTSATGEVPFTFETREFAEESVARITAAVVEEAASTQLFVPVVTTELTATVGVVRPVYLAGEPFDVAVAVVDRAGKTSAREGTVRLFRLETRLGASVEVAVGETPFTTASDGKAVVRLQSGKGGTHRLRVECHDRFGNLVTADTELFVSGDEDEVKVRMLTDVQSGKVGETMQVRVVNRCGARLALRTFQGDGVLAYDTITLPAGESTMAVPLLPLHAPNFALCLSLIDGTTLRVVEREFTVLRDLDVRLTVPATTTPGATVKVGVGTFDPNGRPVSAEVAISVVDAALLAMHADRTPAIGAFFYGERRETAFRTVSSCDWNYRGASSRVSDALVAEDRREAERERVRSEVLAVEEGVPMADPGNGAIQQQFVRVQTATGAWADTRDNVRIGQLVQRHAQNDDAEMLAYFLRDSLSKESAFDSNHWMRDFQGGLLGIGGGGGIPIDRARRDFSETGGWVAAVVTDADGSSSVEITLPDQTTSWQVTARAVTKDTFVGAETAAVATKQDLTADLWLPPFLVAGDEADAAVRLHNMTDRDRAIAYRLAITQGAKTQTSDRRIDVAARREAEAPFVLAAVGRDGFVLELTADADGVTDAVRREVALLPFGTELRAGRTGSTDQEATFTLALPSGRDYVRKDLLLELGPAGARDLVRIALGHGYRPMNRAVLEQSLRGVAARGLGAVLVLKAIERIGDASAGDVAALRGVAFGALAQLIASQGKDGSYGWVASRHQDLRSTTLAVQFLQHAKEHGFTAAGAPLDAAVGWLMQEMRKEGVAARIRAGHALAVAGRARFEDLNALHRQRAGADAGSAARLALAWQASQRPTLAVEALETVRQKLPALLAAERASPLVVEDVAHAASALITANATDVLGRQAIQWLQTRRLGCGFGDGESTAATLAALVTSGGAELAAANDGEVDVFVGDDEHKIVAKLSQGVFATTVPRAWLTQDTTKVRVVVRGRGRVHWSATLVGFADGFRVEDRIRDRWSIQRTYEPSYVREAGKPVPPGFSVLHGRNIPTFRNPVTELPVGQSCRVSLWFGARDRARDESEPMVIEEPIPAGCIVPRDSITGTFDHVVVEPSRVTFFLGRSQHGGSIQYELQARLPGRYRALPTVAYLADDPDGLVYGAPMALKVVPRDTASADVRRWTPDELWALGKARYAAGDLAGAGAHFDELLSNWHKKDFGLREDVLRDVVQKMLFVSIARGDAKSIVRFFEDLKDRSPDFVIPFDKIVAVGRAYLDIGEFERALMVFRGTAEASFLKEAAVATMLESMGEVRASVAFLQKLLLQYPDLNIVRQSGYGIGQKLAALAVAMPDGAVVDERVGRRDELRAMAVRALREFLVHHPEDPLAEEVSFAWATTLIEGRDLVGALAVAEQALLRYPDSRFEDQLLYSCGYVQFALGKHEAAFALLKRIAEGTFVRMDGSKGPSENRPHALYLQGQIHHALGEPAKALALYEQVGDQFSDAAEASDFFLRKALSLPEVTTLTLERAIEVPLTYRNVEQVEVKVYRVDLMRLYLQQKSLNDIRDIRLHGIRPYATASVALGDGRDYANRERKLALALNEPGAYLVVVSGSNQIATGMVLRSDLRIEMQEQSDVGRARVNVKRGDAFLPGAHVKVVGSGGDQQFRSGDTDLRGVFTADGLVGMATVIVKNGDEYAFHRGSVVHQPSRFVPVQQMQQQVENPTAPRKGGEFDAFSNPLRGNMQNRAKQIEWLQNEVTNKQQKGVEVFRTK